MWGKAILVIYTKKVDWNTLFWIQLQLKDVGAHVNTVHWGVSSQRNGFIAAVSMHVPLSITLCGKSKVPQFTFVEEGTAFHSWQGTCMVETVDHDVCANLVYFIVIWSQTLMLDMPKSFQGIKVRCFQNTINKISCQVHWISVVINTEIIKSWDNCRELWKKTDQVSWMARIMQMEPCAASAG